LYSFCTSSHLFIFFFKRQNFLSELFLSFQLSDCSWHKMRWLSTSLVVCGGLLIASGEPQGGFFGGLGNLLGGFRGPPRFGGGGGGGGCRASGPNHNFGGRNYLVSWRLGCTQFTQVTFVLYIKN
jgi:hypothetical protein